MAQTGVEKPEHAAHPVMYEVNARVFLHELSEEEDRRITLSTVPDAVIDRWKEMGVDVLWLMGVWTIGPLGRAMALRHPGMEKEYRAALPDFREEDAVGSPYAVQAYVVPRAYGGAAGLAAFRRALSRRGIALVLDFVVNHTARDHRWVEEHPEYYVAGSAQDERQHPDLFFYAHTPQGGRVIAYGRDPYFPGWTDTAQLNYMCREARSAMQGELERIAAACDGVRCDMAMLVLNDIFLNTWKRWVSPPGEKIGEFWTDTIAKIRNRHPGFLFIAEAYWDREPDLQRTGFDYTYDKRLYDRLVSEDAPSVRAHLEADASYQERSVRFIENHDEKPAAAVFGDFLKHFAAATVIATVPGMVLFHDGQFEGRRVRLPVQLARRREEPVSHHILTFYTRLLGCVNHPVLRTGAWSQLIPEPAWSGNWTWQDFLAFWWEKEGADPRFVVVNYSPHASQCYIRVPVNDMTAGPVEFTDLLGDAHYLRDRAGLALRGMFFDIPGYHFHLFEVKNLYPS